MANKTTPEERERLKKLRKLKELRDERMIRESRRDFFTFQQYVMRDRQGRPWVPGVHHREWDKVASYNPRSVLFAPVEHGKSEQRTVARRLWEIGITRGNILAAIISDTQSQAKKFLSAIKEYIEASEQYQRVFPWIKPGKPWTEDQIAIKGRVAGSKDPTVQAIGVGGALLGARLHIADLDDVLSFENTYTPLRRRKVIEWFRSTVVGRMLPSEWWTTEEGVKLLTGRIELVGTAWHQEDLMHTMAELAAYVVRRDAAAEIHVVDGETLFTNFLWPEQWDQKRLALRREEVGELEFHRQMLNIALADVLARFKPEWIEKAFQRAHQLDHSMVPFYSGPLPTFTGVDLAVGKKKSNDESVIFTGALHPNGMRQLLHMDAGRWDAPEIIRRLKDEHRRFKSIIMPEGNAAQDYIRQWLEEESDIPIRRYITTGTNKYNPEFGVESLAVELENGKWSIPRNAQTEKLAREMIYYDPDSHTGDRLMAMWLFRECLKTFHGTINQAVTTSTEDGPSEGAYLYEMDF